MSREPLASENVVADCHVHFHDCYELDLFLDAAEKNFRAAKRELGLSDHCLAIMLLTETSKDNCFQRFGEAAGRGNGRGWCFRATADPSCLIAEKGEGRQLYLFAGRQVATAEGLEVLALNSTQRYIDGQSLRQTLETVWAGGAVAVIPWGFGKWWFRRGALVSEAIRSKPNEPLFLGDNSGRIKLGSPPKQFLEGQAQGLWTLPGSDPLPVASEGTKAGRYGCLLRGSLDEHHPGQSLNQLLTSQSVQPRIYGELESPVRFCRAQVFMQVKKLRGRFLL